ncbi:MAG: L,D-transpeptidase family protein [Aquificae bacterium]|nr:L,D-transpeptidase family protein [Aquificota bacterium]
MRLAVLFLTAVFVIRAYAGEGIYGNILLLPSHLYGIVVSKSHQKSVILKMGDGLPVVVEEMPSATGLKFGDKKEKGDLKTPEGVYFPVSFKPDAVLPPEYGAGAYPLNYPNALDTHVIKRNGGGIWIHASDKEKLPPFSSRGCVMLENRYFEKLSRYIRLKKTPVVIQQRFTLLSPEKYKELQEKAVSFLQRWEKALLKLYYRNDTDIYLLYSKDFSSSTGRRFDQIRHYKRELYTLGNNEPFVKLFNKTVLYDRRNNGEEYIVARFLVAYLSGDQVKTEDKVLYIKQEKDGLKIISEESL